MSKKVVNNESNNVYKTLEIDNIVQGLFKESKFKNKEDMFKSNMYKDNANQYKKRVNLMTEKSSSKSFGKCKKCGSTENTLLEMQTRSADEAKDFLIICSVCQTRWHAT